MSLASILCSRGLTQDVVITRPVPCLGVLRSLLDQHVKTHTKKPDRYFSMYAAKMELINTDWVGVAGNSGFLFFSTVMTLTGVGIYLTHAIGDLLCQYMCPCSFDSVHLRC